MNRCCVLLSAHRIASFLSSQSAQLTSGGECAKPMSSDDAKRVLNSREFPPGLFPNDIFTISYDPFKLQLENMDIALNPEINVFTTSDADTNQIRSISFCRCIPVKMGIRLDVDFFGKDIDVLIDHVMRQVGAHCQNMVSTGKDCEILIHFSEYIDVSEVEKLMTSSGFSIDRNHEEWIYLEYMAAQEYIKKKETDIEKSKRVIIN